MCLKQRRCYVFEAHEALRRNGSAEGNSDHCFPLCQPMDITNRNSPGTTKLNSKSCGTWLTQPAWSMRYKYMKSHVAQHRTSNQHSNTQTHPKTTGLSLHSAFGQGAAVTILFVRHGHLVPDSPSASHGRSSDLGILPKDRSINHHVQSLKIGPTILSLFQ